MTRPALLQAGAAAHGAGRFADAERAYRGMLAIDPRDAEALSNLAAVQTATACPKAAEASARAALAIRPRYWAALANLGNALHRQQRYPEAVNAYHAALEANPRQAAAWTNLGVALNEQWDMAGALTAHGAAVALAPLDPQVRVNRAMALLMAGEFAAGFAEFEWRWRTPAMAPHGMARPQWRGEPLGGRTILLHAEGGFGDTLQFIRYAPLLADRGAHVVARVQTPLLRLLRRNFPEIAFTDCNTPAHDVHCPMLSLPHAFGTTVDSVPPIRLTACRHGATSHAARLQALAGFRVGVVWQGAPLLGMAEFRAMNARRSIPLAALAPSLGRAGIDAVSLQFGADPETLRNAGLFDAMTGVQDFEDTAAIIANLDLVISVDSAVAHLAAALGKPVWVLSRFDACWRWLAHRRDCPWYPTLRLYRQQAPGDWATLVDQVARDLAAAAAADA